MNRTFLVGFLIITCMSATLADEITVKATDSKSIDPGGSNWNDNRLRAYWNSRHVDGFVKFDLSEVPDNAKFTAMTLTTYHEFGFGNPKDDPEVKIYRVANDSWKRGANDAHPGFDEVLTEIHRGFPTADLVPYEWKLDVNAADWSVDLADDTLSLGMRNEKLFYSYVYWHGADANPKPPELNIVYGGGCDPCDANCDGSLDLLDVEPFIELILGTGKPCAFCTGDTNEDGSIDLQDVEKFIDCLLG